MIAADRLPADIRIGCVPYLNARPLIQGLEGRCSFDHPSELSRQLFAGELDAALIPVAEWFTRPNFLRTGSFGICCDGPVYSVVLAGIDQPAKLHEVLLDDASRTSAALAHLLLADDPPDLWSPTSSSLIADIVPTPGSAALLIGDQAIRFRKNYPEVPVLDLGQAWKERTGLPFVFALWIRRPDCHDASRLAASLDAAATAGIQAASHLPQNTFDHYYLNHAIRYPVGVRELAGLDSFRKALQQQQI